MESKYALKIEADGTKTFGFSDEHGHQALCFFFKWQGPDSSVPYAILNHGYPGGVGLRKLLVRSYSAIAWQVQSALRDE